MLEIAPGLQAMTGSKNLTMKSTIFVQTQFIAYHRWKDAPDNVEFLRNYHRHVFKVLATMPVTHEDRQLEFFTVQRLLDEVIEENFEERQFDGSCEWIANILGSYMLSELDLPYINVMVSEDGENGATVELMYV